VGLGARSGQMWCYVCDADLEELVPQAGARLDAASREFNVRADGERPGGGGGGGLCLHSSHPPPPSPLSILQERLAVFRALVRPAGEQGVETPPADSAAGPTTASAAAAAATEADAQSDQASALTMEYPRGAGLVGLSNLGNTCFMNAGLQALSNVPALSQYFCEAPVVAAAAQSRDGLLPQSYRSLIQHMWEVPGREHRVVSPNYVLHALRRVNPLFEGFAQQDSHEALRSILNDLHERLAVEVPISLYSTTAARRAGPADGTSAGTDGGAGSGRGGRAGGNGVAAGLGGPEVVRRQVRADSDDSTGQYAGGAGDEEADGEHRGGKMDLDESSGAPAGRGDARYGAPSKVATDSDVHMADASKSAARSAGAAASVTSPRPQVGREWLHDGPYTGADTVQRSIVSDLFQGVFCSRVRCRTCGTDSLTYDTFYDLSLPIPRRPHAVSRGGDGSNHSREAASWLGPLESGLGYGSEEGDAGSSGAAGVSVHAAAAAPAGGKKSKDKAAKKKSSNPMRGGKAGADGHPTDGEPAAGDGGSAVASPASTTPSNGGGGMGRFFSSIFCSIKSIIPGTDAFHGSGIGLADCLFSFCDWEPLVGADQYFCEACGCKRDADKRISIASLPEVLCVHLKRFSYHNWGSKNSAPVAFPLSGLDLSPFVFHGAHGQAVRSYVRAKEQQAGRKLHGAHGLAAMAAAGVGARPAAAAAAVPSAPGSARSDGTATTLSGFAGSGAGTPASGGAASVLSAAAASSVVGHDKEGHGYQHNGPAVGNGFAAARRAGETKSVGAGGPTALHAATGYVEDDAGSVASTPRVGPAGKSDGAGGGGAEGSAAVPLAHRRVVSEMGPDTRAFVLHRHCLATGTTGVEAVAAAAAAASTDSATAAAAAAAGMAAGLHAATCSEAAHLPPASGAARAAPPSPAPLPPCLAAAVAVPPERHVSAITLGGASYDLASVVQHMGGLGGGHYIAHGRNRVTGAWYTFDDSEVSPIAAEAVQEREAYVMFYVRKHGAGAHAAVPLPPRAPGEPLEVFVSRYWWLRYRLAATPGPVSNADIVCDHGAIKRDLSPQLSSLAVSLTARQYSALAHAYGAAEPPLRDVQPCAECEVEAAALQRRRRRERTRITEVDSTKVPPGQVWYLMSEWWLARWRAFINNTGGTDGTGRGVLPPGPIDNARLLGKNGKPLPNLRSIVHYRGVNVHVWNFLHRIYGGGPCVTREEINIYTEQAAPAVAGQLAAAIGGNGDARPSASSAPPLPAAPAATPAAV
jgi:ubiquitin C-terminal hydrolase